MKINVERVYDITNTPKKNSILADRLWPRGISKEKLANVPWQKEITPSAELRKWFHQDKDSRWSEFNKKYLAELKSNRAAIEKAVAGRKTITLLTGVRDIERSHIPTLTKFLKEISTD